MFVRRRLTESTHSIQFVCDDCADTTPPIRRLMGYPGPEAWELVDQGRAVLKGCDPNEIADGDHECRQCGKGTEVPDDYRSTGQVPIR